jgi:hypothetical protein
MSSTFDMPPGLPDVSHIYSSDPRLAYRTPVSYRTQSMPPPSISGNPLDSRI